MKSLRVFLGILFASLLAARPAVSPFTEIDLGIDGYEVRFGDCDGDGRLDIVVNGYTAPNRFVRVYKGDGAGGFVLDTNSNVILGLTEGPCIWGDYDNDGDLDIASTGWSGGGTGSRIYRNDGSAWTFLNNGLRGMKGADGAWFDYDNDGDLDLILTGESYDPPSGDYTIIYKNTNGVFTVGATLPGTYLGEVSIGDYDHDGDLDIALTGRTAGSKIFKNNGDGSFTALNSTDAPFPAMMNSSIAWADFDNDGDLDVVLTGDGASGLELKLYRNNNGVFESIDATGIPAMRMGHITWGDYDNDGDLDMLLVGWYPANFNPVAFIFNNNGSGVFTDSGIAITGVGDQSTADWGDFNNDNNLDFVIAGTNSGATAVVKAYQNNIGVANTAPTIPTALAASVVGSSASLTWNASSDAHTPAAGLTYNLRVGTTPGGQQLMGPMSDLSSGKRRVPARGNAQQNLAWTLKNLPPGTYYASVQAVDGAYVGSGWSSEAPFTIAAPPPSSTPRVTAMSPAPGSNLGAKPATVTATLSAPVDPATVSAATVSLVGRGIDQAFGTGDDVVITPASISGSGNVITLDLTGVTVPDGVYRLRLDGTATAPAAHANLFGHWKLTEGTGPSAPDSSGNGRNGTLNGATWGTGLFGSALDFNGNGPRVDINAGFVPPSWSVAMWVCKTGNVTSIATSLMDSNSIYGTSLRMEQSAHGIFDVGITEYTTVDYGFGFLAPLNEWVHLTFTSDASNAKLYVNGVHENSAPWAFNLHVDKLGTARTTHTYSPLCRMSEVQVYDRVLTAGEITSLATIAGCIKSTTGGVLNGEYTGTFPSGDAAPGGDFEATFGINVPLIPPTAFTLISPSNGAVGVPFRPRFRWNGAVGASSYTLQVATDPGFASLVVDEAGLAVTSFRPAAALAAGTVHYWRVTAVNGAGSTTASGAPSSMTTVSSLMIVVQGGCGLLGLELLILLALRRRFRSA